MTLPTLAILLASSTIAWAVLALTLVGWVRVAVWGIERAGDGVGWIVARSRTRRGRGGRAGARGVC